MAIIMTNFMPFTSVMSGLLIPYHKLPLGALVFSLFCCYKIGWGWDNFIAEANAGKGLKVQPWMKPIFKFVVPAVVAFLYIYGLCTFGWK